MPAPRCLEAVESCYTLAVSHGHVVTAASPLPGSGAAATNDESDDEMAASLAGKAAAS